jgi:hypothetical protein
VSGCSRFCSVCVIHLSSSCDSRIVAPDQTNYSGPGDAASGTYSNIAWEWLPFLPQGVTQSVGGCETAWLGMARQIKPSIFCVKYWEIVADNLSKAGCSWGCVSVIDSNGQTIWIADAHRDNGKRFVVQANEKLTAFVELERVTQAATVQLDSKKS